MPGIESGLTKHRPHQLTCNDVNIQIATVNGSEAKGQWTFPYEGKTCSHLTLRDCQPGSPLDLAQTSIRK